MGKLKVLTLTVKKLPKDFLYSAIDSKGAVLATRVSCRSSLGTTYIAAFVTKNYNMKYAYSLVKLATSFGNIKPDELLKFQRPYGIAVVEEHKEAFKAWAKSQRKKIDNVIKSTSQ